MIGNASSDAVMAVVDYSHMGRRVTGIERISAELFSPEALGRHGVLHTRPATALGMIRAQWLEMPLVALKHRIARLFFPGFPPSVLVSLLFRERVVPYIHDLFLLERKSELNVRARFYMRPSFIYAVRHLKYFVVNSRTTAAALGRVCRRDAQVMMLRPRAGNVFGLEETPRRAPVEREPLKILMLGTLEPRKNYFFAAKVAAALARRTTCPVELHVSGRDGWGGIGAKLGAQEHVFMHGYLSPEALRELAGQCHLYLSTSLDEGLGLPLLELLYGGMPMALSDIPVFREVASEASAVFLSCTDVESAADTLAAAINNPDFFAEAMERARLAIRNWNALAEGDATAFQRFLRERRG